jgi:hypothetical protein
MDYIVYEEASGNIGGSTTTDDASLASYAKDIAVVGYTRYNGNHGGEYLNHLCRDS